MIWKVVVLGRAEGDLADAAAWYEQRERGLGFKFIEAVRQTWNRLVRHPRAHPRRLRPREVRSVNVPRFPYLIFYEVDEKSQTVSVVALLHQARDPRLWRERFPEAD